MSDGGTGDGLSYWANIQVSGKLTAKDLQELIRDIQKLLNGKINGKDVDGKIVSQVRASNKSTPTFTVSAQPKK